MQGTANEVDARKARRDSMLSANHSLPGTASPYAGYMALCSLSG